MAKKDTRNSKTGKKKEKLTFTQAFQRELRGYAEAFVFAFVIITFIANTVGVVGASMEPNLDGGSGKIDISVLMNDRVFIPKYETWLRRMNLMPDYQRGDIVVVREPKNAPTAIARADKGCNAVHQLFYQCRVLFIKRLIGLPGDRIRIENGQVYVNDIAMDQSFIEFSYVDASGNTRTSPYAVNFPFIRVDNGEVSEFRGLSHAISPDVNNDRNRFVYGHIIDALAPLPEDAPANRPFVHEIIVPEGEYFIMGDNRSRGGSEDSRYFGSVPKMMLVGRASAVIWPPRRDGAMNWRALKPPEAFTVIPEPNAAAPVVPDETE